MLPRQWPNIVRFFSLYQCRLEFTNFLTMFIYDPTDGQLYAIY